MRILMTIALLGALLPAPAQAQTHLNSAQLDDFVGQYVLADGRLLSIVQRQHALVAQVEGRREKPLVSTGPARFAARDGSVDLTFDQRSNGNVASVKLLEKNVRDSRQARR